MTEEMEKGLEIEVEALGEVKVETPDAGKEAKSETESALADLRRQIEESKQAQARERLAREEAERRAREASDRAERLQTEATAERAASIDNSRDAWEAKATAAERAFAEALASGDHEGAAKAQRRIAEATNRLQALETEKVTVDKARPATVEGRVEAQKGDEFEEWASRLSPASATWARAHRDVFNDPLKTKKIGAAHTAAIDLEGFAPDSPEYFSYIEKRLGLVEPEKKVEVDAGREEPRRALASVPVNSGAGSNSGSSRGNRVTLSAAEVAIAHDLYPDEAADVAEKKYAINKLALIREGKLAG